MMSTADGFVDYWLYDAVVFGSFCASMWVRVMIL